MKPITTNLTATYECVHGHKTTVKANVHVSVALKCPHLRPDGKSCEKTAYYQATDAELDAAARELQAELDKKQVVYSSHAQSDLHDAIHPYGY